MRLFERGTRAPEDSEKDGEAGVEPEEAVEADHLDIPRDPNHVRARCGWVESRYAVGVQRLTFMGAKIAEHVRLQFVH